MTALFALNTLWFSLIAIAGVIGHVIKKWADDEIKISVLDWFLGNPKSTVVMLFSVFGSLFAAIAAGQVNNINDLNQVALVFVWGFACNSAVNKQ